MVPASARAVGPARPQRTQRGPLCRSCRSRLCRCTVARCGHAFRLRWARAALAGPACHGANECGETWRARTSSWEWQDRIGAEAATDSGTARVRHYLARAAVLTQRGVEECCAWREHSERRGEARRWSVVRRAAWVCGAAHILKSVVGRPETGMVSCANTDAARTLQGRCTGAGC